MCGNKHLRLPFSGKLNNQPLHTDMAEMILRLLKQQCVELSLLLMPLQRKLRFDSNGDNGPPCGPPSIFVFATPFTIVPAPRYLRTSLSIRLSHTRRFTHVIMMSWLTLSKNFSRSSSTHQLYPAATCFRAISTA